MTLPSGFSRTSVSHSPPCPRRATSPLAHRHRGLVCRFTLLAPPPIFPDNLVREAVLLTDVHADPPGEAKTPLPRPSRGLRCDDTRSLSRPRPRPRRHRPAAPTARPRRRRRRGGGPVDVSAGATSMTTGHGHEPSRGHRHRRGRPAPRPAPRPALRPAPRPPPFQAVATSATTSPMPMAIV